MQARAVAALVAIYMPHLPFGWEPLRMLPRELVEEVKPPFDVAAASTNSTL
jgi:hypothetical protein